MNYELVVVGASLGGFDALTALLGGLAENCPLPVAVVQHRSACPARSTSRRQIIICWSRKITSPCRSMGLCSLRGLR